MIRRLYVHNFRCLENFELPISGRSSTLLIGKNGAGKTTVGRVLEILQRIARGTNRVGELVKPKDFARGRTDVPIRFEIEVDLQGKTYAYSIALELPDGFKELRVREEKLAVGENIVYTREPARVELLARSDDNALRRLANSGTFPIDWHLVALPIIQRTLKDDPLFVFKQWLSRMLVLGPIPSLIPGDSNEKTLEPNREVTNLPAWFSGLLASWPAAYGKMEEFLKQLMPDMTFISNPEVGKDTNSLIVHFSNENGNLKVPFEDLSDGEKCFIICAVVVASNSAYGPVFCFWDEPDNYLSLSEVGHFVLALRKAFQSVGQFIATSHNPEAISRFSSENTLVLYRKNHLEPTTVRPVDEIQFSGDLVGALIRDDLEP